MSEALAYLKTDAEFEPAEPDPVVTDPTGEACLAGIFYKANIAEWWNVNAGRFPNLGRMARDMRAVQGGGVGLRWVFSMARDVIPYRHS